MVKYPCPGSPKHWSQSYAKDDGSACFNHCCNPQRCTQGCAWMEKYPCPGSPKQRGQTYAKDDGSACFNLCCKLPSAKKEAVGTGLATAVGEAVNEALVDAYDEGNLQSAPIGAAIASTIAVADYLWVTDEEKMEELRKKEALLECDCDWTSTYVCPMSALAKSAQAGQIAKDDGSPCFHYCCGVVEAAMNAATLVIQERNRVAAQVDAAYEQHLQQQLPAAPRTSSSFGPGYTVVALALGIGLVAVFLRAAPRRATASALV